MSQNNNLDIEKLNQESRDAGVCEEVISYVEDNLDLFEALADENFESNE